MRIQLSVARNLARTALVLFTGLACATVSCDPYRWLRLNGSRTKVLECPCGTVRLEAPLGFGPALRVVARVQATEPATVYPDSLRITWQNVPVRTNLVRDGGYVCRPCSQGAYFSNAKEITWADMNWAPSDVPELTATHDRDHHSENHGKRRAEVIALR